MRGGCKVLCEADLGCVDSEKRSWRVGLSDLTWPGWDDDQLGLVAPPVIDLGTRELNHR